MDVCCRVRLPVPGLRLRGRECDDIRWERMTGAKADVIPGHLGGGQWEQAGDGNV